MLYPSTSITGTLPSWCKLQPFLLRPPYIELTLRSYFMPIRWYKYHKIGFHYFLADLCYFVNMLLILSIWFFPQSKRLLISTFCLAFGNNAVAIAMWRNSLVFHSLDKVTS